MPLVLRRPALVGHGRARRAPPARRARAKARPTAARPASAASASAEVMSPPTAASATPARAIAPSRELERRAGGDDGPVADAAVELLVRAAGAAAERDADLDEHLGRADGGLVRAAVELVHADDALAAAAPRITIRAPTAAQTADRSSDGSAWQSAPPIVPRLRTTGSAITRSASVKIASRSASSVGLEQRAVARHRADPDLVAVRARRSRARRRADRCRSRTSGAARRSFIIGSSEWPAGEQPCLRAELFEQRERVLDARGALVAERCWDLQDLLLLGSPRHAHCRCYGRACQTGPKRSLRPPSDDPRPAPVVRPRGPPRLGQGGRRGARGDRARGVGRGRRAAQGARRRAVRPQRPRDRADARRAAARGARRARSSASPSRRAARSPSRRRRRAASRSSRRASSPSTSGR